MKHETNRVKVSRSQGVGGVTAAKARSQEARGVTAAKILLVFLLVVSMLPMSSLTAFADTTSLQGVDGKTSASATEIPTSEGEPTSKRLETLQGMGDARTNAQDAGGVNAIVAATTTTASTTTTANTAADGAIAAASATETPTGASETGSASTTEQNSEQSSGLNPALEQGADDANVSDSTQTPSTSEKSSGETVNDTDTTSAGATSADATSDQDKNYASTTSIELSGVQSAESIDSADDGYYLDVPPPPAQGQFDGLNPPKKIQGRFVLAKNFYTDAYHHYSFPGKVTIYDQKVHSFGTDADGSNGLMYCISPGAANWGDPQNANNRSGTVYATYSHSDKLRGLAWYKVDYVQPDKQPAQGVFGVQYLGGAMISIKWSFGGIIRIQKVSASSDIVRGNSAYTMDGISYGVYKTSADAKATRSQVGQIVLAQSTDSANNPIATGETELETGTYYVRELGGGKGYSIDPSVYTARLDETSFDTTKDGKGVELLELTDEPIGDTPKVIAQKLDAKTGKAQGFDDPKGQMLADAEFTVRYYSNYYGSVRAAEASGKPTRTWTIRTGAGGTAKLDKASLTPGSDALYLNSNGLPTIPLGTVLIQETKAPLGYLLPAPNEVYLQQIKLDASGQITRLNPYTVKEVPRELTLCKVDASTNEPLGGANFTLYKEVGVGTNKWQVIVHKITNADGGFSVSPVEPGSYKLVETKAPVGYQMPAESGSVVEHLFAIGGSNATTTIVATNYKQKDISIDKLDIDSREPVPNTEFTIYAMPVEIKDGMITTNIEEIKADDTRWVEAGKVTTDSMGKAVFANLSFGYYQLVESRPNPKYTSYKESGGADRFVKLDKFSTDEAQVFEDSAVQVAVEVYKKTIAVTSSGLDGSTRQTDNNVGKEEYIYRFGARSNSNVWVDEFIITDDLSLVTSKGYRMTTLWTGTSPAGADYDDLMTVLYRTNLTMSDEVVSFSYDPLCENPANPNNPNKNMTFSNTMGWRIWQEGLSTTKQSRLEVSDLKLKDGEYIIGIKVVYGGVVEGFYSGRGWVDEIDPHTVKDKTQNTKGVLDESTLLAANATTLEHWAYAVVATSALLPLDEMGGETVMRGGVSAEIAKNDGVLQDDDIDAVETRVIEPFTYPTRSNGIELVPIKPGDTPLSATPYGRVSYGGSVPKTGDSLLPAFLVVGLFAGGVGLLVARRRAIATKHPKR